MHTFKFNDTELRTVIIDGTVLIHATDACRILGLSLLKGTHNHTSRLAEDEKVCLSRSTPGLSGGDADAFLGRCVPRATAITESGLNKLVMRSDKPDALKFQDWIARDVLPSIRKTGGYLLNEGARETAHAPQKSAILSISTRI